MSEVEQTADDGAQVAPVAQAAEGQQTPVQAQESTAEQVATPEQDKPRDDKGRFVPQERVNEITKARRDAERRAEALERELANYRQQPAQHQPQSNDKPPSIADFGYDMDAYSSALTQYAVAQAQRSAEERFSQQDSQRHRQQLEQQFEERSVKFAAEHPDFNDAVAELGQSVQFRPEVVEAIGLSDHGPALAYHLAKHLDEADRIARLPPHLAALQLGRIEAQITAPKPKPVTNAPNPPPTLGGGSASKKDLAKLSYADYRKQRMGE